MAALFEDTPYFVGRTRLGSQPPNWRCRAVSGPGQQLRARSRIRRMLQRARPGTVLAQKEYRDPILETVERLGGEGEVAQILDGVYDRVRGRLMPLDHDLVPSGVSIRWKIQAMYQRKKMIADGLLDPYAPKGTWRLTEEGRRVARDLLESKRHTLRQ